MSNLLPNKSFNITPWDATDPGIGFKVFLQRHDIPKCVCLGAEAHVLERLKWMFAHVVTRYIDLEQENREQSLNTKCGKNNVFKISETFPFETNC